MQEMKDYLEKLRRKFEEEEELQFYTKAKMNLMRPLTCGLKKWIDHDPEKLQQQLDGIIATTELTQEQIIEENETGQNLMKESREIFKMNVPNHCYNK